MPAPISGVSASPQSDSPAPNSPAPDWETRLEAFFERVARHVADAVHSVHARIAQVESTVDSLGRAAVAVDPKLGPAVGELESLKGTVADLIVAVDDHFQGKIPNMPAPPTATEPVAVPTTGS